MKSLIFPVALVLSLAACSDSKSDINSALDDLEDNAASVIESYCICWEDLPIGSDDPYSSEKECENDVEEELNDLLQTDSCVTDALMKDENASLATINCANQSLTSALTCMGDLNTCSLENIAIIAACEGILGTSIDACPELPDSVNDALDDC